jgi:hypothetical protein
VLTFFGIFDWLKTRQFSGLLYLCRAVLADAQNSPTTRLNRKDICDITVRIIGATAAGDCPAKDYQFSEKRAFLVAVDLTKMPHVISIG